MKAKYLFLIFPFITFLYACDNNDKDVPGFEGQEFLWTPSLYQSVIGDSKVTLVWSDFDGRYYGDIDTKCFIPNYVNPEKFEVYQSDNMKDNFVKIAEFNNKNTPFTLTVNNLTNGKPVYFRIHSLRKKYETMQSSTFKFIPNPKPNAEVVFISDKTIYQSTISPDGTKIAFIDYEAQGGDLCVSDINGSHKVKIMNGSSYPAWNSEGTKIYFISSHYSLTSKIMSYDVETKEITYLMQAGRYYQNFSVSPDESKILYDSNENGSINLYLYNRETAKDSMLMSSGMSEPLWIDNENYLIKKSNIYAPYTINLSLITLSGNKSEELISDYGYSSKYAVLSPDKKNIAYISCLNEYPQLYVYNISTKETRQLTGYEDFRSVDIRQHITWKDNNTLFYTDIYNTEGLQKIVSVSIN